MCISLASTLALVSGVLVAMRCCCTPQKPTTYRSLPKYDPASAESLEAETWAEESGEPLRGDRYAERAPLLQANGGPAGPPQPPRPTTNFLPRPNIRGNLPFLQPPGPAAPLMPGMLPRPPNPLAPLRAALPSLQPANLVARWYQTQAPQPQVAVSPVQVVQQVPVGPVLQAAVQVPPAQALQASVQAPPGQVMRLPSYTAGVTIPPVVAAQVIDTPVGGSPRYGSPLNRSLAVQPGWMPVEAYTGYDPYAGYAGSPLPTLDLSTPQTFLD